MAAKGVGVKGILALFGILFGSVGAWAQPKTDEPISIWNSDRTLQWVLYPDLDSSNRRFYYFPHLFEVTRDADGSARIIPSRADDGSLQLDVIWGMKNWRPADDELVRSLRSTYGPEARLTQAVPISAELILDPRTNDIYGANWLQPSGMIVLPGTEYATTIVVPSANDKSFRREMMRGGLLHRILLTYQFEDPVNGVEVFPFETTFFLGKFGACEVTPEHFPCRRTQ